MMSDRLDTGDELGDDILETVFLIRNGVIHVWYDPGADEDEEYPGWYEPVLDPYQELSILQFERAEISERITNLLECMKEVEGATDIATQVGSAVPVSLSKDHDPPGQSSD